MNYYLMLTVMIFSVQSYAISFFNSRAFNYRGIISRSLNAEPAERFVQPPVQVVETCAATRYASLQNKAIFQVGDEFNYTYRWSAGIVQLGSSVNGSSVAWFTPYPQWNNDKAGTSQLVYDSMIPANLASTDINIQMFGRTASGQIITCQSNGMTIKAQRQIAAQAVASSQNYTCQIRKNASGQSACLYFTGYAFYTVGVYDCSNGATVVVHKYTSDDKGQLNCYNRLSSANAPANQSVVRYSKTSDLKPY